MNNLADAGLNFALAVKDHEVARLMELTCPLLPYHF
jgi:hypothetical protein